MANKVHDQMSEYLDATLIRILKEGRPIIGPDGQPISDRKGGYKTMPASASDLNIARQRLRDLGVDKTKHDIVDPKEIAEQLRSQDARIDNFNLPELPDGDDPATEGP